MRHILSVLLIGVGLGSTSVHAQVVEAVPTRPLRTFSTAPTATPAQLDPNQTFDRRPAGRAPAVTATAVSPSEVRIRWDSVPGVVSYVVRRNPASAPQLLTPAPNAIELVDQDLYPNTTVSYEVWADFGPESPNSPGHSSIVTATTPPPVNPAGFTAYTTVSGESNRPSYAIMLRWDPTPGAAYYEVKGDGQLVYEGADSHARAAHVPPGDHYYEVVAYYGPTGAAVGNTAAPATVWGFAYRFQVSATVVGPVTVKLWWPPQGSATGYDIFRQKVDPASSPAPALQEKDWRVHDQKQNEFFDTGLEKGATYRYYVDTKSTYPISASGAVRITVPQ